MGVPSKVTKIFAMRCTYMLKTMNNRIEGVLRREYVEERSSRLKNWESLSM
jgi:hypothetical protein